MNERFDVAAVWNRCQNLFKTVYEICGQAARSAYMHTCCLVFRCDIRARMGEISRIKDLALAAHDQYMLINSNLTTHCLYAQYDRNFVKTNLPIPFFSLSMLLRACSLLCWSQPMSDDFRMVPACGDDSRAEESADDWNDQAT